MKTVLKLAAAAAVIAAAAYAVIRYWETLEDLFYVVVGKIKEKIAECPCCSSDCEDFEDVVVE